MGQPSGKYFLKPWTADNVFLTGEEKKIPGAVEMEGSVEEQDAEYKIEYDQQDQDTVHYQVDPYIGFILPVKLLQPPEHSAQFYAKVNIFPPCHGDPTHYIHC